jgi:hypothetical protein
MKPSLSSSFSRTSGAALAPKVIQVAVAKTAVAKKVVELLVSRPAWQIEVRGQRSALPVRHLEVRPIRCGHGDTG